MDIKPHTNYYHTKRNRKKLKSNLSRLFHAYFSKDMSKAKNNTITDILNASTSISDITSTTDTDLTLRHEAMMPKRPYKGSLNGEPPAKRAAAPTIRLGAGFKWNLQALATAADAVESGGKSPVSALNELGVKVFYTVLRQGGPAHCPSFNVAVTVADMTFEGWGHSKREARASAARACLAALLASVGRVIPSANSTHDFTNDLLKSSEIQGVKPNNQSTPDINQQPESICPMDESPSAALFGATPHVQCHKSPINLLYENYPGLIFNCTYGDGTQLDGSQVPMQLSHSMRFKVVCHIKDNKFEGFGSSKKLAKLAAARSALAVLEDGSTDSICNTVLPAGFLPQVIADLVSRLVNEKFNQLMLNDLIHSKRKVLAGIVLTIDNRLEESKVIAVTTGTKCVSGEHMSVRGRVVNDSHAEVVARRCLQRYLYKQLLMYTSQSDCTKPIPESDLEPVPGGGYRMKPDRQLHLYVSTAPCGDGRIFSPHEQHEPEPDRHPNRLARGQLRTKIESGEGTIPVKNSNSLVQTWDGVMQGERLLTMSCSDKVARWCVLGVQGALLSRLLCPVYLHSLVLGSLMHPHHMYRALCGRIEDYIDSLPPPFRLVRPMLARAASMEARTPARAPSFSVCWSCTSPVPEMVNTTTGKLENGQPSMLCKQSMFARWQYLVKKLPPLEQETTIDTYAVDLPTQFDNMLYNEAKQTSTSYQEAKVRLLTAFERAKLGKWIKKPLEQDQFICELKDADPKALFAWVDPDLGDYSAMQASNMMRELENSKIAINYPKNDKCFPKTRQNNRKKKDMKSGCDTTKSYRTDLFGGKDTNIDELTAFNDEYTKNLEDSVHDDCQFDHWKIIHKKNDKVNVGEVSKSVIKTRKVDEILVNRSQKNGNILSKLRMIIQMFM